MMIQLTFLIHLICSEVPSPYYFYEFNCNLSGSIPVEISKLDGAIHIPMNDLPKRLDELNVEDVTKIFFIDFFFSNFSIKGTMLNISPTLEP